MGSGPPLLLVHGIGGDADGWAFCFEAFSRSHRMIALDLPGFGRSDKPRIEYHIAGFVETIERFLLNLKIDHVALLGESLGGWIAASFALKFPKIVDKLVLVDAAGVWGNITKLPIDVRVSTRDHMGGSSASCRRKRMASRALLNCLSAASERGDSYTIERSEQCRDRPRSSRRPHQRDFHADADRLGRADR